MGAAGIAWFLSDETPEELAALLQGDTAGAADILSVALVQSEVKIFADCPRPWVQDSNATVLHIPESTLSHAEVTYAPELLTQEDKARDPKLLPMLAKLRAMERALGERSREAGRLWSNLVCVGGAAQHTAVQKCMKWLSKSGGDARYRIKSIKLIQRPSLAELQGQLRLLALWLPKIFALDESLHLSFEADFEHLLAVHERFRPDAAALPGPTSCEIPEAPEPKTPGSSLTGGALMPDHTFVLGV